MSLKDTYKQLIHFLNGEDSIAERKSLTDWYDQLQSSEKLENSTVEEIQKNVKLRFAQSIGINKPKNKIKSMYVWAAAAAICIVGYVGYQSIPQTPVQDASVEVLSKIAPAQERALIVLENGEEIDLDKIGLNQQIQIGETIISKDGKGKVSYHNADSGKPTVQSNSLRIPRGATYQLTLVDGTHITLNSGSKLTYPSSFGETDRVVKLEGEAYFEVSKTKNKSRFIIESAQQKVEVLGTKFNLKAYPEEDRTKTTLAEGSVKVSKKNSSSFAVLKPDQQSTVNENSEVKTRNVVLEEELSWLNNQFYFDGTNTKDVLREIARWYDVDIEFDKANLSGQYKGKIPRNLSLDKLIQLLKYAEIEVRATVENNERVKLIIK